MLRAYFMPRAHNAALEKRQPVLDGVGMNVSFDIAEPCADENERSAEDYSTQDGRKESPSRARDAFIFVIGVGVGFCYAFFSRDPFAPTLVERTVQ